MEKIRHSFPEGKSIICNEKITLENYKDLLKKCFKANIDVGELFIRKPISKEYVYFGWDGYKICRYYLHNDMPKVSLKEFNSFFNDKKPKEETFLITKEQILELCEVYGNDNSNILRSGLTRKFRVLFPDIFKNKFDIDFTGWCKTNSGGNEKYLVYFNKGEMIFGFDGDGKWFYENKYKSKIESHHIKATNQEVEQKLSCKIV